MGHTKASLLLVGPEGLQEDWMFENRLELGRGPQAMVSK